MFWAHRTNIPTTMIESVTCPGFASTHTFTPMYDTYTQQSPLRKRRSFIRWTSYTPCTMNLLYKSQSLTVNVFDIHDGNIRIRIHIHLSLCVFQSISNTFAAVYTCYHILWTLFNLYLHGTQSKSSYIFPLTTHSFKEKNRNPIRSTIFFGLEVPDQ